MHFSSTGASISRVYIFCTAVELRVVVAVGKHALEQVEAPVCRASQQHAAPGHDAELGLRPRPRGHVGTSPDNPCLLCVWGGGNRG